ncbi:hypothetical protein BDF19DRAFT_429391 [Syncephalis fuscata]|nr:hypothetical protein BDF19DRAFT_429391 [Syncephalis fuscata]
MFIAALELLHCIITLLNNIVILTAAGRKLCASDECYLCPSCSTISIPGGHIVFLSAVISINNFQQLFYNNSQTTNNHITCAS